MGNFTKREKILSIQFVGFFHLSTTLDNYDVRSVPNNLTTLREFFISCDFPLLPGSLTRESLVLLLSGGEKDSKSSLLQTLIEELVKQSMYT